MADARYVTANRLTEDSRAIQAKGRNRVLIPGPQLPARTPRPVKENTVQAIAAFKG